LHPILRQVPPHGSGVNRAFTQPPVPGWPCEYREGLERVSIRFQFRSTPRSRLFGHRPYAKLNWGKSDGQSAPTLKAKDSIISTAASSAARGGSPLDPTGQRPDRAAGKPDAAAPRAAGLRAAGTRAAARYLPPAAALCAALLLAGCGGANAPSSFDSTMPPSGGPGPTSTVTSAPLETAQSASKVPVYWLGRSNNDVYLYREYLPGGNNADPIQAALQAMTSQKPLDSDYFSPWKKASTLSASISAKNVITVDISSDAFSTGVDEGIAQRAIQQLVYTATASAANAGLIDSNQSVQVVILVDGHTDYQAFGKVKLDKPLSREGSYVAPVWVIDPQDSQTLADPIKVNGRGISADGKLSWQLLKTDSSGSKSVYLSGSTAISSGPSQLGTFSFTVAPPPGTYELCVFVRDPADPTAQPGVDSKKVVVR
jgi:spore germination protein GerM